MSGEASKAIPNEVLWEGGRSPFSVSYGKLMMWFFLVSDALSFTGLLIGYGFVRHSLPVGDAWPMGETVFRALPFTHGDFPLMYVAFMTALLIFSSVTMVLAVEAGHRMDKKNVVFWLFLTVLGGAGFVGSQAWEWSHFEHGSGGYITTSEGEKYWVHNNDHDTDNPTKPDNGFHLVKSDGTGYLHGHEHVEGDAAMALWNKQINYVAGAPYPWSSTGMVNNEYGPAQYANFFYFITGFHGFHVASGVVINIIILLGVMRGVYHRRGHYEMVEKAGLYWHFVDLVWVFVFTFFYLV
ncbi:MAG: cytochrome c oxidase subunit 3 [Flavobacteriales bacterium]|nr:cytochrome c oxidase subunit 3 [Flavobacteriales bacterium]MBK7556346.1 cytochrome c oxidase subunit 3 [Flavobacteriales bacterium]MBK9193620.1 cytochrome c oxidase subunit 3 [Flavobacteriales bacterium]MBP6574780.1 cytochrome c oxidase subunit 3 [Flavobacteriales bacterium]